MIRRLLGLVLLSALFSARAFAQDPTITATLSSTSCPGTGCVSLSALNDRSMATVEVSGGAWTGTLLVEISSSSQSVPVFAAGSKVEAASITANGVYQVPMAGASAIRVRASVLSLGTPTVKLSAGQGSADFTLPVGAATAAKQDTVNASVASIDGKVVAVNTGAVVVASSALPAGAATAAAQGTGNASLSSIDGKITAVNTGAVVVSSSALPSGAATSALQASGNSSLSSIDGKTPALGQAAMAASSPVVIASNQSAVPVSGTVTSNAGTGTFAVSAASLPLPTGAATEASLSALNGKVTAVDTGAVVVASSALPAGASTSAKQPALGTAGSPSTDVLTVQGRASMTPLLVDGSATTQPVSAAALPLPAGAATSAKQPALGTAGASSADVLTVQGRAAMTPLLVDGSGATQPVSATQLPAALAANGGMKVEGVAGGVAVPVSATALPLPSGASTSGLQTTGNTSLSSIDGKLTNSTTTSGSITTLAIPLTLTNIQGYGAVAISVSGTWTVGGVGLSAWCTLAGTAPHPCPTMKSDGSISAAGSLTTITDNGTIVMDTAGADEVTVFGQTGTGTAAITLTAVKGGSPKFPFGTQSISQATAASLNAQVQGAGASGAAKTGNPVQVGAVYNSTQPTVTNGQTVEAQASARGGLIVATGADTFAVNLATVAGVAPASKDFDTGVGTQTLPGYPLLVAGGAGGGAVAVLGGTGQSVQSGANALRVSIATDASANGVRITDGTSNTAVKAASTPAAATDPSVVVALSPNSPLPAGSAVIGHVITDSGSVSTTAITSAGPTTLNAAAQTVTLTANNLASVTFTMDMAAFGATVIFECSVDGGTVWAVRPMYVNGPAVSYWTYFYTVSGLTGTASIQGSGASCSAVRVRVSAYTSGSASMSGRGSAVSDILPMDITSVGQYPSGTGMLNIALAQSAGSSTFAAIKSASTAAAATDPALVVAVSPNNTVGTNLAQVNGATTATGNGTAAGSLRVSLASDSTGQVALAAGTNGIGKLTANSGVVIGDVNVVSEIPGTGATNLGKAEDAPHTTGDVGVMSMGIRKDTNAQTTNADGDYTPGSFDAYGAQFTRVDHPNRIRCTVTVSTATTIQAVGTSCAAPGAGLSIYITDIEFSSSAAGIAADAFPTLKYGTGGTCGTGTTVFWGALSAAAIRAEKSYATPIKIPANNEVCWITSTAGSKFLVLTGYIAP